ncbi:energy transducer TonB [Salinimonas sp. HHU 13199]|uniref:Energy transducer TonB n=1 Tax=Salinimonas profundi TaxID=2729140 RepID=A0ABR8LL18_9ALTE|nr:energy transducer TonB [Salinimonas profundi]MBD3584997.1 energy transducer TonB [Salinimonas profundi]
MKKFGLLLFPLIAVGCNTTDSAKSEHVYPQKYVDLTAEDGQHLLEKYWILATRKDPALPPAAARESLAGCTGVTFLINSKGRADGYKITNSYPEGMFDRHVLAALARWRYKPAEGNPDKTPVLTSVSISFTPEKAGNANEAAQRCENLSNR